MRTRTYSLQVLLSCCVLACCSLPLRAQLPPSLERCLPYPTYHQEVEEMFGDSSDGPAEPVAPFYPQAQITSIRFYGAREVPAAEKEKIAQTVEAQLYYFNRPADLEDELEESARWAWEDEGYFRASVQVAVKKAGPDGETSPFEAIAFVQENGRYRVGKVSFRSAGADEPLVFPPEQLRKIYKAQEGDVFRVSEVRKWLEALKRLYADSGYVDFTSEPRTGVNDRSGIVDITMVLDQGKQYRISSVVVETLNPKLEEAIQRGVTIGDIFDYSAFERLLEANKTLLPEGFSPFDVELVPNLRDGTVKIKVKALDNAVGCP